MLLVENITLNAFVQVSGVVEVTGTGVFTTRGLQTIATYLGSPFAFQDPWMPFIAIGQGETAPGTEDITLEREVFRKRGSASSSRNKYFLSATFQGYEPDYDCIIREVGMLDKIAGGDLAVRWLLDEDIDREEGDVIQVTCEITVE